MHELTKQRIQEMRQRRKGRAYARTRNESPASVAKRFRGAIAACRAGTYLAKRIKWLTGITGGTGCGCKSLQSEMDKKGCDWCETNSESIVDRMLENRDLLAESTGIPIAVLNSVFGTFLLRRGARQMLSKSIAQAREAENRFKKRGPQRTVAAGVSRTRGRLNNSPVIPAAPIPFMGTPRLTLMFHVYPLGDGWQHHARKLMPVLDRFDRKLLGVAVDHRTASVADVMQVFGDDWEVTEVKNNTNRQRCLREVATYQEMLPTLRRGVDDVTFCAHAKGVQPHNTTSEPVAWWTDAMYETILYNIEGVLDAMRNGAAIVGSFRRHGKFLNTVNRFHFSGTFYAFRNVIAFSNGVPAYRQKWWGTESWPGDHFPVNASHCVFGDHAGDMYKEQKQLRIALTKWRANHGDVPTQS